MDETERELRRHDPTASTGDAAADEAMAAALRTAAGWVGGNVSVVGAGEMPDGAPCVVVHASDPTGLPDDVEGVPVVVVVAEPPHAQPAPDAPADGPAGRD